MGVEPINPVAIQNAIKANSVKTTTKDFNAFLGATSAMSGAATSAGSMYGDVNSSTVIASAFSGIGELNSFKSAGGLGLQNGASYGYLPSGIGGAGGGSSSEVVPGTGFTQWDMINTMNQNNLQLLELQAVMQSNMQAWNTKSNILSADHRARMAMIEKFTAR